MIKHMEKIARLCWNARGWRQPSGKDGKSKSKDTYEQSNGFGHEEWLLDDSRIYKDGYHYGFLEQLRKSSDKHCDKEYDIHIYTISPNKQRVYLGCLKNATGISHQKAEEVYKYYKKKGWIDEMRQEVINVKGNISDFNPKFMFNVKFKFEDAKIYYSNQPILAIESIPSTRYNLLDKKNEFKYEKDKDGNVKILDVSIFERSINAGKIIIDPLHKKIQNAVAQLLKDEYSKIELEKKQSVLSEQRVDIIAFSNKDKEWHFFEIKTLSAKRSIREALGQILEYAHYPNNIRANKLYIIGPEPPDKNDKAYMQFLRKRYSLPIWYRWYSFKDHKLDEGI